MEKKIYGSKPQNIRRFENTSDEMFFYQYLPICLAGKNELVLPSQLKPFEGFVKICTFDFVGNVLKGNENAAIQYYAYLTAKRLFITPDKNLNRDGWHSDGFMTDDINYIWSDIAPTKYIVGEFENIPQDHCQSLYVFDHLANEKHHFHCLPNHIYRLDETVIHAQDSYSGPAQIRTFLKLSFSTEKYNLKGNSHNYDLDYKWEMKDRDPFRNHPSK